MGAQVKVDGVPAKSLGGYVGDVSWSHTWPGGCAEASWSMAGLAKGVAHPILRRGARVEIKVGSWPVWAGVLDQPGAGMGSFTARGLSREAARFMALDALGAATYSTNDAITQAIDDGLAWTYATGTAPAGIATDKPEYLNELLDISGAAASERWGVDGRGRFFSSPDPTTPTYHAVPGSAVLGQADDDYATHLYGRYVSAVSGTPPVPSAWGIATVADEGMASLYGRSAHLVDLTSRGLMADPVGDATAILAGMLANGRARIGFTERLELADYQLLRDGAPAPLALVTAGEMVRLHGAISPGQSRTNRSYVDFVIAETNYAAGARSVTLAPLGLAPRTLADVLAVTVVEESVA